jgi:hypothetical protein
MSTDRRIATRGQVAAVESSLTDYIDAAVALRATLTDVDDRFAALLGAAPANLDTLEELAAGLADEDDAIAAIVTALSGKVDSSDSRLTDARTPSDASVTNAKVAAGAAIALTKLADIAAARLLGNNTGSPGPPIELTAAQVRTFLAVAAIATSGSASDLSAGTIPSARMPNGTWVQVNDTTLATDLSSHPVSGLGGYKAIKVGLLGVKTTRAGTTTASLTITANSDTGANYTNGATTGATAAVAAGALPGTGYTARCSGELTIQNDTAGAEKHIQGSVRGLTGSTNITVASSWINTSSVISSLEFGSANSASLAAGSRIVVWGLT